MHLLPSGAGRAWRLAVEVGMSPTWQRVSLNYFACLQVGPGFIYLVVLLIDAMRSTSEFHEAGTVVHQGKKKDQSGLMPISVVDLGFSFRKTLHRM